MSAESVSYHFLIISTFATYLLIFIESGELSALKECLI